jgi:hypothetical protein
MNYIRAFKVAVKNLSRFHPRFLSLFKKNKTAFSQNSIKKAENIFIMTSCINTNEKNSQFVNHNIAHTPEIRLKETITGLNSIKQFYPDSYIIFIESSVLCSRQRKMLDPLINDFLDYSNFEIIKIARKHFNKGVPQFTAYIKFLEENKDLYEAGTFHFIGARYVLTGNSAVEYNTAGSYMLFFPEHDNVSTRYFFIKGIKLKKLIKAFRITLYFAMTGNSVEDILHGFIPDLKKIKKLNLRGIVNGQHIIYE